MRRILAQLDSGSINQPYKRDRHNCFDTGTAVPVPFIQPFAVQAAFFARRSFMVLRTAFRIFS